MNGIILSNLIRKNVIYQMTEPLKKSNRPRVSIYDFDMYGSEQ
jgi:hypothetical protein